MDKVQIDNLLEWSDKPNDTGVRETDWLDFDLGYYGVAYVWIGRDVLGTVSVLHHLRPEDMMYDDKAGTYTLATDRLMQGDRQGRVSLGKDVLKLCSKKGPARQQIIEHLKEL